MEDHSVEISVHIQGQQQNWNYQPNRQNYYKSKNKKSCKILDKIQRRNPYAEYVKRQDIQARLVTTYKCTNLKGGKEWWTSGIHTTTLGQARLITCVLICSRKSKGMMDLGHTWLLQDKKTWCPDSGACHHVTNDLNNLSIYSSYQGSGTVKNEK